jgi:hypothetical protein
MPKNNALRAASVLLDVTVAPLSREHHRLHYAFFRFL